MNAITRLLRSAALVAAAAALVAGCAEAPAPTPDETPIDRATEVRPEGRDVVADNWHGTTSLALSTSCEDADAFAREMISTSVKLDLERNRRMFHDGGGWPMAAAEGDVQDAGAPANESSREHSDTNTQVDGVDEADVVETDGTYLYSVSGQDVAIMQAWPPEATAEVGRVTVPGYSPTIYLQGDRLIVLSHASLQDFLPPAEEARRGGEGAADAAYYGHWQPATVVTQVDVRDPADPVVRSQQLIEGWSLSSRRIDDTLLLVQNSNVYVPGMNTWPNDLQWDADTATIDAAFDMLDAQNQAVIAKLDATELLPERFVVGADGRVDPDGGDLVTGCDALYRPSVYSGSGLLTTVGVDLNRPDLVPEGASVLGGWGTVYAARDALYIAATNWDHFWFWAEDDDDRPEIRTQLHKFALVSDRLVPRYVASGSVPGTVLNQFALDQHEGRLRVATTEQDAWWWGPRETESHSGVHVLEQHGGELRTVGSVTGLGLGERIFAVRFMGDQGYVVTFRQVDPLYVLDLRDPTAPAVTGELKIPGFSSYIHPLGDGHLLTVGREATDEGQIQGLSFQIFDVRDPAAPALAHKTVLGADWGTWSEAQWDHHAFTYFAPKGLLAVPVSGWQQDHDRPYGEYRSELRLFRVSTEDGVVPAGAVDHRTLLDRPVEDRCFWWSYGWESQIRRGVFIEDFLYSVSQAGVLVHHTAGLEDAPLAACPLADPATRAGDEYCWLED